MILHSFPRSGPAIRVRIALNLKGIAADIHDVQLHEGEQHGQTYRAVNPEGLVPLLDVNGVTISQSLAILEYLEEAYPDPPLLPADPMARAQVRSLVQMMASDIHPLGNLRVLHRLKEDFAAQDDAVAKWYDHWMTVGLIAVERRLAAKGESPFCYGDTPTFADICLVAQAFNATRFGLSLAPFPQVRRINDHALTLKAFADAVPQR